MSRMFYFAAGLLAGAGGALLAGVSVFPGAEAAQQLESAPSVLKQQRPDGNEIEPKFLEQRCAPGFRHSPNSSGRYTCNRIAAVRCPGGGAPSSLKLYRSGSDAARGARLVYDCRMSQTVRPRCGRQFQAVNLKLYRSGGARGGSRLIYECVRYRRGN